MVSGGSDEVERIQLHAHVLGHLLGAPHALHLGQRGGQRRALAARHPHQVALPLALLARPRPLGHRPEQVGARRAAAAPRGSRRAQRRPASEAIRVAGGKPSARRSASSRSASQPGSQRTSAWTTGCAASAATTTCPPADAGRTSAAAFIQRRSVSSPARRSARPSSAQESSSSAAPYPPLGDRLGARGGDHQRRARRHGGEHARRAARGAHRRPGKARASSSAVRDSPTTAARSFVPWQCGQSKVAAGRAHQRQAGMRAPPGPGRGEMPSGPRRWRSAPAPGSGRRPARGRSPAAGPAPARGRRRPAPGGRPRGPPTAAGPSGRGVAGQLEVVAERLDPRRRRAHDRPGRRPVRAPSPTRPAAPPRRCVRSRRHDGGAVVQPRALDAARRGRAGTAPAARRGRRRRRPRSTTRPRSRTGANIAARVPSTTWAAPREAARNCR